MLGTGQHLRREELKEPSAAEEDPSSLFGAFSSIPEGKPWHEGSSSTSSRPVKSKVVVVVVVVVVVLVLLKWWTGGIVLRRWTKVVRRDVVGERSCETKMNAKLQSYMYI